MAEQVKYVARQRFKYNGVLHKPGDEWTPTGSRLDESIIRNRLVSTVRIEATLSKPDTPVKSPAKAENPRPVRRAVKE